MFKIGEFSKLTHVSSRMLRHYEKCGLLYPVEINRETGYRFYSANQISLLNRIVSLRDLGFSIDEICDVLPRFEEAGYMEKALSRREASIKAAISGENEKLERLARLRAALINKEETIVQYEVILKELPPIRVLSLREILPAYDVEGMLWEKMGKFMAQNNIACPATKESGYSIYWDDDYRERDVDVEIAVPVETLGEDQDGFVYKELPGMKLAATLRFAGPYENYAATMETLASWIEQNGYGFAGLIRGVAIRTAQDQSDPQNYLTEIQVPVQKM